MPDPTKADRLEALALLFGEEAAVSDMDKRWIETGKVAVGDGRLYHIRLLRIAQGLADARENEAARIDAVLDAMCEEHASSTAVVTALELARYQGWRWSVSEAKVTREHREAAMQHFATPEERADPHARMRAWLEGDRVTYAVGGVFSRLVLGARIAAEAEARGQANPTREAAYALVAAEMDEIGFAIDTDTDRETGARRFSVFSELADALGDTLIEAVDKLRAELGKERG